MAQPNGVDFHLPDEILSVMPTDPYDQLDLARKITSMAIAGRVNRLESQAASLRQRIDDRDLSIAELQEKVAHLDRLVQESDSRLRDALEENAKLVRERDALAMTSKKLGRNLSKLETFKKQLMKSLSDDNPNQQAEAVEPETYSRPLARVSSWRDHEIPADEPVSDHASGSTAAGDPTQDESRPAGYQFSITPYVPPRLTTISTPEISSTVGSFRGFSTARAPPEFVSTPTSPTKPHFDGHTALSSSYPSSQQSSAPSSPPKRRSFSGRPRMDGKEIFRQARSRLSYEQFGAFLASIKEFNANRQSREETLEKAEEIFGTDNRDLFISFQNMLNRNLPES